MRLFFCSIILTGILFTIPGLSQNISFTFSDSLCLGEENLLQNTSSGFSNYNWDFCQGDLMMTPEANSKSNTDLNIPIGTDLIESNGLWYGFVNSMSGNEIIRLEFGEDITNPNPIETNLGNIGGDLNSPQDISVVTANGQFYIFTYNRGFNQLVRINLGEDITNPSPTSDILLTGYGYVNGGIDVFFDGNDWVVALTNASNLTLVNLGSSPGNIPAVEDVLVTSTIIGANGIGDINFLKQGNIYYALLVAFDSRTIHRLTFGNSLFTDPSSETLDVPDFYSTGLQPYGISGEKENGEWVFFLATIQGSMPRLNFGSNITNNKPAYSNLGNLSLLSNSLKINFAYSRSRWVGLTTDWSGAKYFIIEFPEPQCSFDKSFSLVQDQVNISSLFNGDHAITLRGKTSAGNIWDTTRIVHVKNSVAPGLDFITENACINNENVFLGSVSDESEISDWTWRIENSDFSGQEIFHKFDTSGTYDINLSIITAEGCRNEISKSVTIFDPPVADFEVLTSNICTNSEISFQNNSSNNEKVIYSWDFNGEGISDVFSPVFIFETSGEKNVQLIADISGCRDTVNQLIHVNTGPAIDFSYSNNCFGDSIIFFNESVGENIHSYLWDFGDSNTSNHIHPKHRFEQADTFMTSLSATNDIGCESILIKEIIVNNKPIATFNFSIPVIENLRADFTAVDHTLSDDKIVDWKWIFPGGITKTDSVSSFVFDAPGEYEVNLIVNTSQGCSFDTTQIVAVEKSIIPVIDFEHDAEVCLEQNVVIINNSINAQQNVWDLCQGDFSITPEVISKMDIQFNIPIGASFIKARNNWYAFICSMGSNEIFRLDFGKDLINPNPVITNLGNYGGLLNAPQDIKVVEFESKFYAFVNNRGANQLIRINIGTEILNETPTGDILLSEIGFSNGGIDVVFDDKAWIIAVTRANTLILVDLGEEIDRIPVEADISQTEPFQEVDGIGDVKFIQDNGSWFGFITGFNSQSIHLLSFGKSLFSNPVSSKLQLPQFAESGLSPYGITTAFDNGTYNTFISTLQGNLIMLKMDDLNSDLAEYSDLGNFNSLGNNVKIDIAKDNSQYVALTSSWNSQNYQLIFFAEPDCSFENSYLTADTSNSIQIKAINQGESYITLTGKNPSGVNRSLTKKIIISQNLAPNLNIINNNNCITNSNNFKASTGDDVTFWSWDFGDSQKATGQEVEHQYSSTGKYFVRLDISNNSCSNSALDTINIYLDAPKPYFDFQTGTLCTSNEIHFKNLTEEENITDSLISYSWNFNNEFISSSKTDTKVVFTTSGDKNITLTSSIPGCSNDTTITATIIEGANVDFSFKNECEATEVQFTNLTSGNITDIQWTFGNGDSSKIESPSLKYPNFGDYQVRLEVLNDKGCISSKIDTIIIHDMPIAAFNNTLSCEGLITEFHDKSTVEMANITTWEWMIDDIAYHKANPSHTFTAAGNYLASLKVISEYGCTDSLTQAVDVMPSPVADFSYDKTCLNEAVNFKDNSSLKQGNITTWKWFINNQSYTGQDISHKFSNSGDQVVSLIVTADNLCRNMKYDTINILTPPEISFVHNQACTDQPIQITSHIISEDPIESREWLINDQIFGDQEEVNFLPVNLSPLNVLHNVTTTGDCRYSKITEIPVYQSPLAQFEASTVFGGAPLEVIFFDESERAKNISWFINDLPMIVQQGESNKISEVGVYKIIQLVEAENGCKDSAFLDIDVVNPTLDLELKKVRTINDGGNISFVLDILNKGTAQVKDVDVEFSINNEVKFKEKISYFFNSGEPLTRMLASTLENQPRFICLTINAKGLDLTEENPEDNVVCVNFEDNSFLLRPYPNPAREVLTIPVLLNNAEDVEIKMINSYGAIVFETTVSGYKNDLINYSFSVRNFPAGYYIIKVTNLSDEKTFPMIITH